jgi:cell division protein FtsL
MSTIVQQNLIDPLKIRFKGLNDIIEQQKTAVDRVEKEISQVKKYMLVLLIVVIVQAVFSFFIK